MLHNFENRKLEWFLAFLTLIVGVVILLPYASMTAGYNYISHLMTENVWGTLYVATAVLHMSALQVNGRASWTPLARMVALMLLSQVHLANAISLLNTTPASPMGTTSLCIAVLGCGFCFPSVIRDYARVLRGSEETKDGV